MNCSTLTSAILHFSMLGGSAAAQAPPLSIPAWIPGDAAVGAAAGEQTVPRIAAGGGGYLAVWSDSRSLVAGSEQTTDLDVFALRLDAAGVPLDATPIPVATRYGYQRNPRVAWNGSHWLVVWESQDATAGYYADALRAVRVAPDGTVADPQSILVRATQSSSTLWSMCANGSEWVVVLEGTSAGDNDLVGVRVGANGTLLTPVPVVLQPAEYFLHFGIQVVAAQGQVLVAWAGANNPVGRRFDTNLAPLGGIMNLPTTNLGSRGSAYFAAWLGSTSVVGSPVALDGTVQTPAGTPILPTSGVGALAEPAWDGSRWWVAAQHVTQGLLGARVAPDGVVIDPGGVVVQPPAGATIQLPRVAGGLAGGAQFAWSSFGPGNVTSNDVFGRRADAAFALGTTTLVSRAAPAQLRPAVCAGPSGWIVLYESTLGAARRILVERLDAHGGPLDPEPLQAGTSMTSAGLGAAWNGSLYCLVWNDGAGVVARRMLADGTFLDATPLAVMPGASADVDAVGGTFLVATTHTTSFYPEFRSAFVRRLDGATGAFLDAGPVNAGGGFAQLARVAAVGGRWLVVFQSNWSHDNPQADIVARFVNADGSLGGTTGLGTPGGAPDVADGAGAALVVWRHLSPANANNDVVCRRVLYDGTLGPIVTLSAAPGRQMNPRVAWDGAQWLVAWEDQREQQTFFDKRTDVYGARVSAAGALLDPASFVWLAADTTVAAPAIAAYGARTLLAASVLRPEIPHGAFRIAAVRTLGDCASPARFCSAGANSSGFAARIDATGGASLSTNQLVLHAANLPSNAIGLFFQGTRAAVPAVPFGNGLRCVAGAVQRLGVVQASAGSVSTAQDLGGPGWVGTGPTDVRYVQFWFRDPAAGGMAFDTSDALELTFCP